MSIMYIRGEDGKFYPVTSLKGEKGDPGDSPIESVNGYVGVVVLSAADVGALPLNGGGTVVAERNDVLTLNAAKMVNSYLVIKASGANRATFGHVRNLACVSNEVAKGARIGVNDQGVPEYRTTSNESTAKTLIHTGNIQEGLTAWGLTATAEELNALPANVAALDRDAIIEEVIAAIGTPVFGRVDENNNIILTGELANGPYTLKYEGADGSLTEIGNLVLDDSLGENISLEWSRKTTINSETGVIGAQDADYDSMSITQSIPLEDGILYTISVETGYFMAVHTYWYDASGTYLGRQDHKEALGYTQDYNIQIPASVELSPLEGAASFITRLNYMTTLTDAEIVTTLQKLTITKMPS